MATAGIRISANFPELKGLGDSIRALGDKKFTAQALKDALEKAIFPAYRRLREVSPVGPTGNLKAAATYLAKAYPKDGSAVGLIGYKRSAREEASSAQGGAVKAGPDRAFHQWWIEYGTQPRIVAKFSNKTYQRKSPTTPFTRVRNGKQETVNGRGVMHDVRGQNAYIASSFNKLGPFTFKKGTRGVVQTDPAYPRAFFKKSRTPIQIPAVRPGGNAGLPPVRTAFDQTQAQVAFILTQELRITLQRALDTLTIRDTGTISGV